MLAILLLVYLVTFQSRVASGGGPTRIPLTGNGWTLVGANNTVSVDTSVPTDVYMSLYNNKLIPDPYAGENDVLFRNLSWQNWTLSRQFEVSSDLQNFASVVLIVSWVDTVTKISVNEKLVGTTDNMFRTYVFDVKSALDCTKTSNSLTFSFSSPLSYSLNQASAYKSKYGYDVPIDCPKMWQHGECHPNFIRKMQSSYSWDWGPAFPTMGIYDNDFSLYAFNTCKILQFSVVPTVDSSRQFWILNVDFFIYCAQNLNQATFAVDVNEITFQYTWTSSVQTGRNRIRNVTKIPIDSVQKWYPNGLGPQKLYAVQGSFAAAGETDSSSLNLGFRTVELVQEPVQNFTNGLTFYFKINDVPVFLKGSNWIPADSFLDRITEDRLQFYFSSMKDANFNALRVWGGGVYETEEFYDLADQNGIMIFQDMMFAVNLYPTNPEFLDTVTNEIYDQVNRLKHRPSIIVWAGNNENEAGIVGGWYPMDAPMATYTADYMKLYNTTIWAVINETDYFSRPYLLSSPSNGIATIRAGGIDSNPYSTVYGDTHIYKYLDNGWNPKTYPIPRCCTEFGFQSYPSIETLLTALSQNDLAFFNRAILHRQHHPGGQMELLEEILMHFDLFPCNNNSTKKWTTKKKTDPESKKFSSSSFVQNADELVKSCQGGNDNDGGKYFEEIAYLTQIHQAMAYKTETEHYRRWMSSVNPSTGEGITMCALYWQLNDIWQAPTWASIDYGMKWKMVHNYAKNFFAPLLVSPFVDGETLKISVISDSTTPLNDVSLVLDVHSWDSLSPKFSRKIPLKPIPPLSATIVFQDNLPNILGPPDPKNVDLFFNTRLMIGYQYLAPNNVYFPQSFKKITKDKLGKVSVSKVETTPDPKTFLITLATTSPAPFVWLNVKNVRGWFTDNGFTMTTQNMQISFNAWQSTTTLADVSGNLTVTSLGDIYRRQKTLG